MDSARHPSLEHNDSIIQSQRFNIEKKLSIMHLSDAGICSRIKKWPRVACVRLIYSGNTGQKNGICPKMFVFVVVHLAEGMKAKRISFPWCVSVTHHWSFSHLKKENPLLCAHLFAYFRQTMDINLTPIYSTTSLHRQNTQVSRKHKYVWDWEWN